MQKGMRSQGRKQRAQNASIVANGQDHQLPSQSLSRPRTRAWAKQERQEQQEQQNDATKPKSSKPLRFSRRIARKRGKALESPSPSANLSTGSDAGIVVSRHIKQKGALPRTGPPVKSSSRSNPKGRRSSTNESLQNRKGKRVFDPKVSSWLREVEVTSSAYAPEARALYAEDSMASTSVPMTTLTYESTVNAARSGKSKLWGQTFRCRRIWVDASPDDRLAHFKTILKTELPERRLKDTGDLQHLMRDFLQKTIDHGEEICYPYIDDFSFGLDQTKSKLNYPIVNERYFQADLKRCLTGNESILQRTVMMHIISQYWLGENFDWNCEGKWTQPKDSLVPSTKDDQVSSPKPDLAISFTLRSFIQEDAGADPIPDDLEETLSPNGVEDINRCFPFLFMEVKQAGADLQNAYMTNLHTASQALHNMYTWIVRTKEKLEDFFRTARVFSLVLNAHNLSVRVHRLHPLENGAISYRFDEIWPLARYSQIEACLLIKTIVNEYAAKELHPILKRAFAAVTEQEHENVYRKRKTDHAAAARSSNRPRNSQDTGEQDGDSHLGMGSSLST